MVAADFDSDGILDFAVLTYTNYTVSTFHGNGDGTFTAAAQPVYVGFDIENLAVADFNGDGHADILVAAFLSNSPILLGKGDGTFTTGTPLPQGAGKDAGPTSAVDFNGDGIADVVALNSNSSSSTGPDVFLGKGDGTFTFAGTFGTTFASSMAVADFNGDGTPDITLVTGSPTTDQPLALLLGQSGLTSTATATGISPQGSGFHQVAAVYGGDGTFSGSTSSPIELATVPYTTTLVLTSTPGSSTYGQQIVLSAALTPFSGSGFSSNGESVNFYSGTSYLGSGILSSGIASLNVTSLQVGANSITARYGGDTGLSAVTSSVVVVTVSKGTPTITWNPPTSGVYGTLGRALNASSNASGTFTYTATPEGGTPVSINAASVLGVGIYTLTAKLTPSDTTNYNSASSPSSYTVTPATLTVVPINATRTYGTVNPVFSATTTGSVSGDLFTVTGTTTATASSSVGTYPITYNVSSPASANYTVSNANGTLTITQAHPTLTWNTPEAVIYGTALSAAQLNAVASTAGTFIYSPAAGVIPGAGTQTLSVTFTSTDQVNYAPATATTQLVVAQAGTRTTLVLANQNQTLTANVASLTSGLPTGTVTFFIGQTILGTGVLNGGVASYNGVTLPSGNATLSAQYGGDANFSPSTSQSLPILAVLPASSSVTVGKSGSVTDMLTVATPAGYNGSVQFTCTGLPSATTCLFSPSTVSFNGSGSSASVTVTLQTGVANAQQTFPVMFSRGRIISLAALIGLPGMVLVAFTRRRCAALPSVLKVFTLLLMLSGITAGVNGCSSGSNTSSGTSTTPTNTVTPSGTTTFQVVATGTGGLVQNTAITLNVQ